MIIKLYTLDPVAGDPYGDESYWRLRGIRKTARGAVKLRRKLEAEGYDKDVSICHEVIDDDNLGGKP